MLTAIGASLMVGVLTGAAAGNFVTSRTGAWRPAPQVDSLAQWRERTDGDRERAAMIEMRERERLLPFGAGCNDCSDFERGYSWARNSGINRTEQCESYSWSYQRGCIAWLRTGRPAEWKGGL